MSDGGE
ncbi:Hypothetical protein SSCIU_01218 [Mammaliicoccus sciuri]|nr:Hypothetical protein SSCIU_01218 [Mammaliicoccus sciuri]